MAEYLIAFNDEWTGDNTMEELEAKTRVLRPLIADMTERRVLIFTGGLDDAFPVYSVDAASGVPVFSDGPYVESKEHLGGVAVIEVATEEEARHWAGRIAEACGWPQEVHRFQPHGLRPAPLEHPDRLGADAPREYLIAFNEEWTAGDYTPEELEAKSGVLRPLIADMTERGLFVFLGGLDEEFPVYSVDAASGTPVFTDGPYVESKEHLGGFAVIEAATEEEARLWAGKIAEACGWPQEVHRFQRHRERDVD